MLFSNSPVKKVVEKLNPFSQINKVSRFITGADKDSMIPVPVFRCDDCGHINEEFRLK